MNRKIAYPFLTLDEKAVPISRWEYSYDGIDFKPLADRLEDWAYSVNLHLRRKLSLDMTAAEQQLHMIDAANRLTLIVTVGTGAGRIPRLVISRSTFTLDKNGLAEVYLSPNCEMISSSLNLKTDIVLTVPEDTAGGLSPVKVGSRLWSDELVVSLENNGSMFPIEVADFSMTFGDAVTNLAPWYFYWNPRDWVRDFQGAVRLFINASNTLVIERVQSEDPLTLQLIMADLISQLTSGFVRDHNAYDDYEHGSLGYQTVDWMQQAWPGKPFGYVKELLDNRPGQFYAAVLALSEVMEAADD